MTNELKQISRRTFARSLALGLGSAYAAPALANEGFFGNQAEWTQRFDADGRLGVPRALTLEPMPAEATPAAPDAHSTPKVVRTQRSAQGLEFRF